MLNINRWLTNQQTTILLIVAYSLYAILSFFELFYAFKEKETPRKIIKPFLMFTLTFFITLIFPEALLLYLGCFFGIIGDIFFIFKSNKKFIYLGLVAFAINHIFYILFMFHFSLSLMSIDYFFFSLLMLLLAFVVFTLISYVAIKKILKINVGLNIAGSLYCSILILDFLMTILSLCFNHIYMIISILGMVLFIISDSILSYTLFKKDIKRRDFYIMLTYILAQGLFTLGCILSIL